VSQAGRSPAPEVLTGLAAASPTGAVLAIAAALEDGTVDLDTSSVGIVALRGVDSKTARECSRAFGLIRSEVSADAVALALRSAVGLRDQERLRRPEIEIVWTGPEADGPLVRPTSVVVPEMLEAVHDAGEILLVGYSLSAAADEPLASVVGLLCAASRRGARVTIALHRDEEGKNRDHLLSAWDPRALKPRLLTWDPPPEFPYTKLHAKVLVVDRLEALITSANMTLHGLQANLELGLRIRGPQAREIATRFDHLMSTGVLREWGE
jgi:cardiolipin synthase A/B